jgi:hypothetical protein
MAPRFCLLAPHICYALCDDLNQRSRIPLALPIYLQNLALTGGLIGPFPRMQRFKFHRSFVDLSKTKCRSLQMPRHLS